MERDSAVCTVQALKRTAGLAALLMGAKTRPQSPVVGSTNYSPFLFLPTGGDNYLIGYVRDLLLNDETKT